MLKKKKRGKRKGKTGIEKGKKKSQEYNLLRKIMKRFKIANQFH